jgi:hypothetical protein
MHYYRIIESTDLKFVGTFPQRGEMSNGLNINDTKHLFNQSEFMWIDSNVYIPAFKLRSKAKLTDMISLAINFNLIVSEKIRLILESEGIQDAQFVPIHIFYRDNPVTYYLLHFLKSNYDCINFKETEVSIMKDIWTEDKKIKVNSVERFLELIAETKMPFSIRIKKPVFLESCSSSILSIKYVYSGFGCFVSKSLRERFEKEKCTGIRFMELDEQL